MIKFVSDLRCFSPVSSANNADRHDITEIWLKVELNTITITPTFNSHSNVINMFVRS